MRNIDALIAYLASRSRMPFDWGRLRNDCVSFGVGAILAQTGCDPIPDLDWSDERSAARVIRKLGGLEKAFDDRLQRIAPAMAKRGDIGGIADDRFGVSLLVVEGATLIGPGAEGTKRMPRSSMIAAWSIDALAERG